MQLTPIRAAHHQQQSQPRKTPHKPDPELDALETRLVSTGTFLVGDSPGREDASMYDRLRTKSLVGYPRTTGWFATVAQFSPVVRSRWT